MMSVEIKWQGTNPKRSSHAFLKDQISGSKSLCGLSWLTNDGKTSKEPVMMACGGCIKRINKLKDKS